MVRHRTLTPVFAGSNPVSPVSNLIIIDILLGSHEVNKHVRLNQESWHKDIKDKEKSKMQTNERKWHTQRGIRILLNEFKDELLKQGYSETECRKIQDIAHRVFGQYDKTSHGVGEHMIRNEFASKEQLESNEWIRRVEVVSIFNVSRSTLEKARRTGKIMAFKIPSKEVQNKDYNTYPHKGYLYNIKEIEQIWKRRKQNGKS